MDQEENLRFGTDLEDRLLKKKQPINIKDTELSKLVS